MKRQNVWIIEIEEGKETHFKEIENAKILETNFPNIKNKMVIKKVHNTKQTGSVKVPSSHDNQNTKCA